ncbi:DUF1467 family protein [Sneathiella sp.]|uniref:DUF1467 family protein n=1 Tax=Sneathiella sp. TaxID=1964365 RepID=UPI003568301E
MSIAGGVVIFFISWFLVLFMVLPWGVRTQAEMGGEIEPGTVESAPAKSHIWLKFGITTLISLVILGIFWVVLDMQLFDIRAYFQNQ